MKRRKISRECISTTQAFDAPGSPLPIASMVLCFQEHRLHALALHPLILFIEIYNIYYLVWLYHIGYAFFTTAWPIGRTRIVLLMYTIPTWGTAMLTRAYVGRSSLSRKTPPTLGSPASAKEKKAPRKNHINAALIAIYCSLILAGLFAWATANHWSDTKYARFVKLSKKYPNSRGYNRRGALIHADVGVKKMDQMAD